MKPKNIALAIFGLVPAFALAKPSAQDIRFVHSIAEGNTFEAQGGRLALQRSPSADLRDYGTRLISDHGHAQQRLAILAKKKGLGLPGGLTVADQRLILKLKGLKGGEFNRSYKIAVLAHHRHALMSIQEEIRRGRDPEIKAYAIQMLGIVQGHIRALESIRV